MFWVNKIQLGLKVRGAQKTSQFVWLEIKNRLWWVKRICDDIKQQQFHCFLEHFNCYLELERGCSFFILATADWGLKTYCQTTECENILEFVQTVNLCLRRAKKGESLQDLWPGLNRRCVPECNKLKKSCLPTLGEWALTSWVSEDRMENSITLDCCVWNN